ncbi:tyrosine-type recombinase/integrase [Streptomyces sp. NPDC005732]|uniref:tyrosine-type recombinase/integrase n=1 Tax=Streptomyces sp. NPDC005732 TaxID=3157057 RepID=UPI0033C8977F
MTPADHIRLIADEKNPFMHRLLWELLWDGELRLGELLSLDVRDVDPELGTAFVEYPKEGLPKAVRLSPNAKLMVRLAIDHRTSGPLFVSESGQPLSREAVVEQARRAGVSIHDFRLGGQQERLRTPSA